MSTKEKRISSSKDSVENSVFRNFLTWQWRVWKNYCYKGPALEICSTLVAGAAGYFYTGFVYIKYDLVPSAF
jgi:hypothetical protein